MNGFILDENYIYKSSLESYLMAFEHMYDHLEIAPDPSLLPMSSYIDAVKQANNHHFHVPYFVKDTNYDFGKDHFTKYYPKLLSIIDSLRQYSIKTPSMVVHLELDASRKENIFYNKKGLDYLLNFIEQKNMDLNLSVETLCPTTYGSRQDLIELVNEYSHKRIGICWDVVHDYRHQKVYTLPNEFFMEHVNHCHLHGIKPNIHGDIKDVPKKIIKAIPDVPITLELLLNECGENYIKILKNSIELLNKIKAPNQV